MKTYHVAVTKSLGGPGIRAGCHMSAKDAERSAGAEGTVVQVDAPNWNTALGAAVTLALQADALGYENISSPTGPLPAVLAAGTRSDTASRAACG